MANEIKQLHYTRCAVPTPLGIAVRLGWLKDELQPDGISFDAIVESEDVAAREAHYDHSVNHLFRLGGSIPALWAKGAGRETRLLALSWVDEFQGIVTLPDAGIHSPRDLRGRKLALSRHRSRFIDHERASALRGFLSVLELGGVAHTDVEFVDFEEERNSIAQQGEVAIAGSRFTGPKRKPTQKPLLALLRREVDALYLKGPRGLQLVHQLGLQVVVDLGSHPEPLIRTNNCTPRTFTVDQKLLSERPDLVERVVARVLDAGLWAKSHASEAVRFIGEETSTADAWVRHGHGADVHLHLEIGLGPQAVQAITHLKNFLVEWQFIGDFDVNEWIASEPLDAARAQQRLVA